MQRYRARRSSHPNLRLAAALSLFLLPAAALSAQAPPPPLAAHPTVIDPAALASRHAALRSQPRFLGWKFAAHYPALSSKWQHVARQKSPASPSAASARDFAAQQNGPVDFPNAGFAFLPGLPTGYIPTAVATGDFNGDGHMDVAVSNGGDDSVYVMLGNGDGTFQVPEILYTQGQSPTWIAAVDLRNNGHLDLAVTDGDSRSFEIFLGNGDGTFQSGVQIALPQIPTFVLAGDFNNDGKQDLAIGLTIDPGVIEPQFLIYIGDGTGNFSGTVAAPSVFGGGLDPIPTGWIAAGDVNKDGFTDLVTTVTGGFAAAYLNQSGSSFTLSAGSPFGSSDGPLVVGLGDMDEDGCLDAVELGGFGYVTIAKGTCDGNFTQGSFIAGLGDLEPAISVTDVDGDGHLDVVGSAAYFDVGSPGVGLEAGYLVSVLKGDGHGNLAPAKVYSGGEDAFSLVTADFTGDGKPEILTADSFDNHATLMLNDGSGNFAAPQGEFIGNLGGVVNTPNVSSPMIASDLNGDGKRDLLLIQDGQSGQLPSVFSAMLNDGTGKFSAPINSPISAGPTTPFPQYAVGAFLASGKVDIVYMNSFSNQNVVAYFPGNGDGTFGTPTTLTTLPNPLLIISGDFNHDGKLDFVVVGTDIEQNQPGANWQLDVFLGKGDGTFTELPSLKYPIRPTDNPFQIFALDVNHDGKLDLLIGDETNGGATDDDDLLEFLGNGDGTFQAPTVLIPRFGPVAIADVNNDGIPDLISWRDPAVDISDNLFNPASVTVYLGTPGGAFQPQPTYHLPELFLSTTLPLRVADFNGDGNADIAISTTPNAAFAGGHMRILQGNGDGTFVVTGHVIRMELLSKPFVGADFNGDGAADLVELDGAASSFHTVSAAPGPALDIAFDSSPIVGAGGSATVTLFKPAISSTTVTLSSSDPNVIVPSSLTFSAGQQSQSFSFTLGPQFDGTHVLALRATSGTATAVAYDARTNPNLLTGVSASLTSNNFPLPFVGITPGESFQMTLQLASLNGYSGTFSAFQCEGLPAGASCAFASASATVYPGNGAGVNVTVSTLNSIVLGTYPIQVSTNDGAYFASASFQLGIGSFSLGVVPSTIVLGPTGSSFPSVNSTSTNGLNEMITLQCSGLPSAARCSQQAVLSANGGSAGLVIDTTLAAAGDYPFQIVGNTPMSSQSTSALLRVGDFSAALSGNTATLSPGQSTIVTVTVTSLNHYSSQISIICQAPPNSGVTCTPPSSPVALPDGATVTAQVTILISSTAAVSARQESASAIRGFVLAFLPVACLFALFGLKKLPLAIGILVLLAGMTSCGGGGSSGGGGGGGGGGNPPPQVSIPIIAAATNVESDQSNQKALGPFVVTIN